MPNDEAGDAAASAPGATADAPASPDSEAAPTSEAALDSKAEPSEAAPDGEAVSDSEAAPDSDGRADSAALAQNAVEVTSLMMAIAPGGRSRRGWLRRSLPDRVTVADDVSFTIAAGEAVGYVGAAGAGKSTLVDLLSGVQAPTSGTVRICGLEPVAEQDQLVHRIGVVCGSRSQLWPNLSLDESLRILARAHQLPDTRWLARRAELVDRLELAAFITLPIHQLSAGRRIRSELAAALLHEPQLLILDEPTLGLDVVSKEQLRTFLRQENRLHGRTLLLATSDLADVEQVCRRVLVIDHGRLAHDGDLPGLISRAGVQRTLVVDLIEAGRLDDVPGAKLIGVEAGGLRQRLHFTPGNIPAARILADVAARAGIRHLTLEEPDLEDLIRRL